MKGGSFILATRMPLINPQNVPQRSPQATATGTGMP